MIRRSLLAILTIFPLLTFAQPVKWVEGRELTIEGRAGEGTRSHFYNRLADSEKNHVREELWKYSEQSAGLSILFSTDSQTIHLRWILRSKQGMPHLTDCLTNGVDLYALDSVSGKWLWAGIVKPYKDTINQGIALKDMPKATRHFQLYLPTYNGVDSVFIGTDSIAEIRPYLRDSKYKPLVFYGTSIMQGASASRTGLISTAILGRHFNAETINLGFSGNARMESAIGEIMTSIDASCYIIDCLPNMKEDMLSERTLPFVRQLKAAKPATPIILVESPQGEAAWLVSGEKERIDRKNSILHEAYQTLLQEGYSDIYYLSAKRIAGSGFDSTIDGSHLNDLGFLRYSEEMIPVLNRALKVEGE